MQTNSQTPTAVSSFAQDATVTVPTRSTPESKYVFFAGDLIAPAVKATNPHWAFGGVLRPNSLTLAYRTGYVRRCEITPLRQNMVSENKVNVPPAARPHMISGYTVQVGTEIKQYGVDSNGQPDGLLRTAFYPADEISTLTGQVDGLIEMPVKNAAELERAQLFLFPNWEAISIGIESLPEKLGELRAYFQGRLKEAQQSGDAFLIAVTNAALQSCFNFQTWGQTQINSANSLYDTAKAKGWAIGYGGTAEMLFTQLGMPRRDNAEQETSSKFERLIEVLAASQGAGVAAIPAPASTAAPAVSPETLAELEEFRKWKELQAKQQDVVITTTGAVTATAKGQETLHSQAETETDSDDTDTADTDDEVSKPFKAGDEVFASGSEGVVVEVRQFGRMLVKLTDGTEKQFQKSQIERKG